MKRLIVAAALFASSGCARNAYLELAIELPKNQDPANKRYAVVQVLANPDFKIDWADDNAIAPTLLDANSSQTVKLSVEGDTDNELTPVGVKVRFCKDPNCLGFGDERAPTVGLRFERAFYIGQRTTHAWKICGIPAADGVPAVPDCAPPLPEGVEKCALRGCVGGNPQRNYCVNGKHPCEDD